jgi:hypothetical protein
MAKHRAALSFALSSRTKIGHHHRWSIEDRFNATCQETLRASDGRDVDKKSPCCVEALQGLSWPFCPSIRGRALSGYSG